MLRPTFETTYLQGRKTAIYPSNLKDVSQHKKTTMHFLATTLLSILSLTSLVTSGPAQQSVRRDKAPKCSGHHQCWSLYMRWDIPPKDDLYHFAYPMREMQQPKTLTIVDKGCNIIKTTMNQPDPKGPITVYLEGISPGDLTIHRNATRGCPVFTYANTEYGAENDCGWDSGNDFSAFTSSFGCGPDSSKGN
ncbi:hypothetical protein OCU04_009725 [Sclerotinia nivalis]|uniref:Uncharacterized protein n=1 Tax=Sclerotinia nivalis TaxID=352851 RepID=A0A9X0AFN9_9HELO|nr:hypothetical protein OCU04_009725 [Sclerotinia nivalis]